MESVDCGRCDSTQETNQAQLAIGRVRRCRSIIQDICILGGHQPSTLHREKNEGRKLIVFRGLSGMKCSGAHSRRMSSTFPPQSAYGAACNRRPHRTCLSNGSTQTSKYDFRRRPSLNLICTASTVGTESASSASSPSSFRRWKSIYWPIP